MPESSLEIKDTSCSSSRYRMSSLRQYSQSSVLSLPMTRNPYNMPTISAFCKEDNVSECISYINREVSSLGFPLLCTESNNGPELNLVAVLNNVYNLLQLHRRCLQAMEDIEVEQVKSNSNMDYLQLSNTRLKDQLELSKRENTGLLERERQLQLKVKSLHNCLKNEKEEVQKLQSIIASRATQYNHDMKRKEREFGKLKERLNQLLIDKKDKKQTFEVLNYVGRSDGKRSLWKTGKTEARHEGEMYKTLLNDYDSRHKHLLMENAELKKVLQQMKRDMVTILSPRKPSRSGEKHDDSLEQASSEEDEVCDSSRESLELSCEHAREQLTNSIRQQWRRLKSHVERLDSQASLVGERANMNAIPKEVHEEEMDRLKLEIQHYKDFIHTQQQLLQQLNSPCDYETASLLNDCYMQEEKERLKEDWKSFEEKRKNFETERRIFTEAAIRLSHERKAFEEDRATWLKHQFLNLTPFGDQMKPQMSKSQSALSVSFSTSRASPAKTPSTADLYRTHRLIPEKSPSTIHPKQDSSILRNGDVPAQLRHVNGGANRRAYTFTGDRNGSI
ncbi:afadin- and alpha-actinin-binding protein isoform X3 [Salmo trutta]|uniref:afadin- and alpha-actinin-binding protein isoform X3 n=1 Tax=Salmo trutta TaxID=8032 RepID=UPI001130E704|nr:afadin- and alpha-actinin-binding protein isoform X3 [Salmo trutta]